MYYIALSCFRPIYAAETRSQYTIKSMETAIKRQNYLPLNAFRDKMKVGINYVIRILKNGDMKPKSN